MASDVREWGKPQIDFTTHSQLKHDSVLGYFSLGFQIHLHKVAHSTSIPNRNEIPIK